MCVGVLIHDTRYLRKHSGCLQVTIAMMIAIHSHVGQTSETYPLAVTVFCRIGMLRTTGVKTDKHRHARHCWSSPRPDSYPHLLHARVLRVPCHLDAGKHGRLAISCSCFLFISRKRLKHLGSTVGRAGCKNGFHTPRDAVTSCQPILASWK